MFDHFTHFKKKKLKGVNVNFTYLFSINDFFEQKIINNLLENCKSNND
jgi:hypothetical protein